MNEEAVCIYLGSGIQAESHLRDFLLGKSLPHKQSLLNDADHLGNEECYMYNELIVSERESNDSILQVVEANLGQAHHESPSTLINEVPLYRHTILSHVAHLNLPLIASTEHTIVFTLLY